MQNGGVQVGSVPRTMSSAVMLGNAPLGGQYQDSLESLDQATWQGLASHGETGRQHPSAGECLAPG